MNAGRVTSKVNRIVRTLVTLLNWQLPCNLDQKGRRRLLNIGNLKHIRAPVKTVKVTVQILTNETLRRRISCCFLLFKLTDYQI